MKRSVPGFLLLPYILILPVAVVTFFSWMLSHFSLLLSFWLEVLSNSPQLLSRLTTLLLLCRRQLGIKKELPEKPQSPKALDFKPFCRSDNGIYLYQFLGLHFGVNAGVLPIRVAMYQAAVKSNLCG